MIKQSILLALALACALSSLSQISFTGSGTAINTPINAPAIIIDNTLTIVNASSINGATVSLSANFSAGDVLGYTGALPAGITATYNTTSGVLTFTGTLTSTGYQTLLRRVTFRTSSSSTLQRTALFNLGELSVYPVNGHLYELVPAGVSWPDAKADAAGRTYFGLQGYLATITSQSENDFIQGKLSANGWIGASDEYTEINAATGMTTFASQAEAEGNWYWVSGPEAGTQFSINNDPPSQLTYMNWNPGEPNNFIDAEHYGEFYGTGDNAGMWNDGLESATQDYVIEYGGMAGDPAIDITHSRFIQMKATSLITTHTEVVYDVVKTPVIIDSFVRAYSSVNITHAKVTISSGFSAGDLLGYAAASLPPGVTAAYNAVTGVLSFTGTATAANWQTLFRTINFSSSSSSFVNRVATFSAGNMVAAGNGHFYEEVPVATDWFTAKADAAARTHLGLQGYLATITSQSENDFVLGKLSANGWIGGSDHYAEINAATGATTFASQAAAEGNWYWVTGPEAGTQFSVNNHTPTQLTYMNWNTGEPNNLGGNEHHAHYYAAGNRAGRWNDEPSYFSKNFVVEYGGMEGDPILQLSDNRTIIVVTTLPVTGLKFHIVRNGSAALLNWSTESENNTRNYHVLHSTNGKDFTKIGEVAGAQNSAVQKKYSFQHNNPANGSNYYKLQIIDIDGKNDFSPIRELKTGATEMSVFPNPVVSQMIVHHPFIKSGVLLIKNSIGAIMLRQNIFNNQTPVDVSVFAPGVYFAEVTDTQKHSTKIKFVKKQM